MLTTLFVTVAADWTGHNAFLHLSNLSVAPAKIVQLAGMHFQMSRVRITERRNNKSHAPCSARTRGLS